MKKKSSWLWNGIIVLTVIVCLAAFILHYKNYAKIEEGNFQVVSGIYKQKIPLSKINGIQFVPRIPELERKNGFSWLAKEKGVFIDSIKGTKVYVFVDDLHQQKIKMVHHDSLELYVNLTDSLETLKLYERLDGLLQEASQ